MAAAAGRPNFMRTARWITVLLGCPAVEAWSIWRSRGAAEELHARLPQSTCNDDIRDRGWDGSNDCGCDASCDKVYGCDHFCDEGCDAGGGTLSCDESCEYAPRQAHAP